MSIDLLKTEVKTAFDTLSNSVTVTPTDSDSVMQAAAITRMADVLNTNTPITNRYDGWSVSVLPATLWGGASIPYGMRSASGKIYNTKRNQGFTSFQLFVSDDGKRWKTDFKFLGGTAHKARVIDDTYYVFTTQGTCYKAENDSLVEMPFSATDLVKFGTNYVRIFGGKVYTSPDLQNWTLRAGTYGTPASCDVVGSVLVLVPNASNTVYRTSNFVTYTSATTPYSSCALQSGSAYTVNGILIIPMGSTVSYCFTSDGASFSNSAMTMINSAFTIDYYGGKYVMSLPSQGGNAIFGYADALSSSFTQAYLNSGDNSLGSTHARGSLCVHNNTLVAQKDGCYSYVKTDTAFVAAINSYVDAHLSMDGNISGAPIFDEDLAGQKYLTQWQTHSGLSHFQLQFALMDSDGYFRLVKHTNGGMASFANTSDSYANMSYNKGWIAVLSTEASTNGQLYKVSDFVTTNQSIVNWGASLTTNTGYGIIKLDNGFSAVPQSAGSAIKTVLFGGVVLNASLGITPIRVSLLKNGAIATDSASAKKYASYTAPTDVNIQVFDNSFAGVSALNYVYFAADGLYGADKYTGKTPTTLKISDGCLPTVGSSFAIEHNHGICMVDTAIVYRSGDSFVGVLTRGQPNIYSCMGGVIKLNDNLVIVSKTDSSIFNNNNGQFVFLENK